MTNYQKFLDEIEERESRQSARRALMNDGATGAIDIGGAATASAIAETQHPASHMDSWSKMSRVEQAVNAIEGNWHNRQKSNVYADFVDAVDAADAGYSAFSGDIDGTDDESRQAVADLLAKDTDAKKQYRQQQLDRARAKYDEYMALEADDSQYHTPEDIQRMREATKGKGFFEGTVAGAKEVLGGDVVGNAIYLLGSIGANAPELVLGAVGGMAGGALGGTRLANAARAITMAYGSYQNSYGSKMAQMLKERGIDVGDFDATVKAMNERRAEVDDLEYRNRNYATGVAIPDAIASFAASLGTNPAEMVRKLSSGIRANKSLVRQLGSEFAGIAKQSAAQGALGGIGEATGTLAAGEELDAGEVLLEILGEFTTAPVETLQAGVSTSLAYRRDMAKTAIAEAEGKLMENIVAVSEATAVALGNEETVAKWAQRLGAGKEVHAFAQDLVVNGQMEKLQEVDPQLAEDIKKAAEEGTTLSMPVGKVAEIAVKDASLAQEIVKDCRLSVDGMSPRQAEEFKKSGLEESTKLFDKELKRTKATVEQFKSAHNVAQKLKDELIAAGTDRNIAAAQVKPLEMHLARLAGQLGINPEALADELNLRVGVNGKGINDIAYSEPSNGSILTGNPALDREVKNWSNLVDGLTTKPEHPIRMLAHTPAILEMLGAKYRGVFVPPHFFSGALQSARLNNPTHHLHLNITKDILKQIPAALTDPIAVFHNHDDGRYIFMLEVVDDNGATVVIPVEFKADYHGAKLTMALSAYAKNHEKDAAAIAKDEKENTDANKLAPRDDWFVQGVLGRATPVYVNRPKFSAWATERGLQDPTKNPRMANAKTEEDWAKYKADNGKLYQSDVEDYSEYLNYEPKVTSTGKITGAPEWVNNEADLKKMRRDLVKFVKEGESGRFWYEDTARAVMAFVGNDIGLADKMAQLLAIYSPQMGIGPNAMMAVRAYTHWAIGLPAETFSVKTETQDKKAIDVLYNDKPWDGRKTNSFYTNIMYEIVKNNPEGAREAGIDVDDVLGGRATIDLWMLRAFGYANEAASDDKAQGKYSFSENETRRLTARLNKALPKGAEPWTPHQVQAAIWTAVKTRFEMSEVKAKTNRKSHREGLITKTGNTFSYNNMSPEQTRAHHANWRHFAMQPSSKDVKAMAETVGRSFAHEFERQTQIVTWEANPSTALGYAINNASPAVMRMFTDEANKIFRDDNGNDLLAKLVGVALSNYAQGDGGYGGGVSPNILSRLLPTSVTGQKGISREEVRKYARALQYIFKQDAVPFFRFENKPLSAAEVKDQKFRVIKPDGKTAKTFDTQKEAEAFAASKGEGFTLRGGKLARGVVFKFNKALDAETQKAFLDKISNVLGEDVGFTRTGESELVVINFRDDETHLPFLATDEDFIEKLSDLQFEEGELAEVRQTWTEGEYGYWHDWSADSEGQAILQLLGADNADNQGNVRGDSRGDAEGRERTSAQLVRWRNDYEGLLQKYSPEYIQALEQGFQNYRNAEEVAFKQRAFAGGSAQHTKFSTAFIGTGEGNRAWGWGLYFATRKEIAEFYRNAITAAKSTVKIKGREYVHGGFFENSLMEDALYNVIQKRITKLGNPLTEDEFYEIQAEAVFSLQQDYGENDDYALSAIDEIADLTVDDIEIDLHGGGRTFEVEIPESDELLDMQEPIEKQPAKVQEAIKRIVEPILDAENKKRDEFFAQMSRGIDGFVRDTLAGVKLPDDFNIEPLIEAGNEYVAKFAEVSESEGILEAEKVAHNAAVIKIAGALSNTAPDSLLSVVDEYIKLFEQVEEKGIGGVLPLSAFARIATESQLPKASGLDSLSNGGDFYWKLAKVLGGDEEASRLLNENGVKGNTYVGKRDGRCFVIFDDDAVQILDYWQDQEAKRGSYTPANTSTNTTGLSGLITLMEKSDESTFMHESAHFFLDIDTLMASRLADKYAKGEELTEGEKEFLTNLGGFFQWGQREGVIDLGVTDDLESVMRAARQWSQLSTNEQRAMHELFAEGFESYLMTGEAPSNGVRKLFENFKQWLMDVYATATRKPRPISKDVKKLYDLMFATAQEVQEVETANGMIPLFELEDEREETEAKQKGVKLSKEERAAFRKLHKEAQLEAQGIVTKAISGVVGYYVKLRDSAARKIIKDHKDRVEKKAAELREEPRYIAYDILTNGLVEDGKKLKFKLSPEALKVEGYSQETIDALDKKGFLYGRERRGLLSPNRLAAMVGADDAVQLMKDLAEGTKAKAKSPLSKAREALGWTGGMKLSVRELEAAGVDADIIAKLIMRDVAYDSSLRTDTLNSAQLAERTGHDSPVDLIAELVDIQDPRIEAASQVAAQIQMETGVTPEVYTDLQANLAAHNKARSRFLHAEYNAIARMLGQRQLAIYAAREYAKKKVLNVRLGDVRASAYIAAEKRCARDAERAFIAGDYQACLNAKRGQILNHEMARVALEIEDKVIKAQRAARRALKSKGLYKPYQRLLARLVAAHDLTKVSDKLLRQQDDIKALIKELEDDGTPIEGLDTLLTDTTDLKDMTVEMAANYIDAVKELTAVARNRQKQNLMATKARISDIVEEGTELLNEAADAQKQGKQRVEVPKGKWEKVGEGLKSFFFGHIKVQTMCRIFDQGKDNGFFWNLFIRSANKCADFESEERAKTAAKLEEILTPLFGKKGAFDTDKQLIGNKMMSKGERFAAACNMGNESNFERLIAGDRNQWTQANIEALQNSLTSEEWLAVQAVWDLLESFRPQIAEKQKRVYGEEPEWIEPKELTVQTADGELLTLRGGYYPVKYDPYGSNRADRQNDANVAAQELRGAFQSATTNRSFVKSRVKNPNGDPLRLDMAALFSGLNDVIHDLAWHEWLIDTRRVLNGVNGEGSGLRAVIRDRYGYQVGKLFEEWRTHIAEGDRVDSNPVWNYLAGKAGISLMGWSPMSALVQLTGIGYIVPRCGAKSTMKALGMFLQRPMAAREAINKISPLMKNRALTANRHVAEIRSRLDSGNDPWYKKYAYSMLLAVQSMVDTICWLAAYDKAMSDPNVLNDIDPDKAAIAVADQAVIDTQSSGRISDSSDFENSGDLKALTVFYTWANAALNQSYAIYKGESDRIAAFQKLVWMGLLMPTVEKLFRDMLRPEDEDDDEEFDAMSLLRVPLGASLEYHLGLLVGVREFANTAGAVVAGDPAFGYNGPAGTRGAAAGAKLLQGVGNAAGGNGWAMVTAGVDAAGALTGIPSAQINRTIKGLRAIESGQAEGMDALLAPVFGYSGRIKD